MVRSQGALLHSCERYSAGAGSVGSADQCGTRSGQEVRIAVDTRDAVGAADLHEGGCIVVGFDSTENQAGVTYAMTTFAPGGLAERSNAVVLKTIILATGSGVRIPHPPQ